MAKMLEKNYEIVSEKHGIHGVINDYGIVIKLQFEYQGKQIEMGMNRPFPGEDQQLMAAGQMVMDSYVDHLLADGELKRKLMLHYWYVDEVTYKEATFVCAHGIVSGHKKLEDATFIHTSEVMNVSVDKEKKEALILTKNSLYHCPLEYCRWKKQDLNLDRVPEYEWIKSTYQGKMSDPMIEEGKVLLVLSNFDEYYFHSLYYKPEESDGPVRYTGYPHVGMFQDSYLIETENYEIDIRYFPHYQNIEFYCEDTKGCPLFIENIGDIPLYVSTSQGMLKLVPGEQKEVSSENVEKERPVLPRGNLYPAGIIK